MAALMLAGASLLFTNCIGNFNLTKSVLSWNERIGSKFLNELVFVAFWILPVYEVTSIADLLILNSIEFWSGKNPTVSENTEIIPSDKGNFKVVRDTKGYTIIEENSTRELRLNYDATSQAWSVLTEGREYPFMSFVDDTHVKMITPQGDFKVVEISEAGVLAYSSMARETSSIMMAER